MKINKTIDREKMRVMKERTGGGGGGGAVAVASGFYFRVRAFSISSTRLHVSRLIYRLIHS